MKYHEGGSLTRGKGTRRNGDCSIKLQADVLTKGRIGMLEIKIWTRCGEGFGLCFYKAVWSWETTFCLCYWDEHCVSCMLNKRHMSWQDELGFFILDHKESNFFIIFYTSGFPLVAVGLTAAFAMMVLVISVNFFWVLKIWLLFSMQQKLSHPQRKSYQGKATDETNTGPYILTSNIGHKYK